MIRQKIEIKYLTFNWPLRNHRQPFARSLAFSMLSFRFLLNQVGMQCGWKSNVKFCLVKHNLVYVYIYIKVVSRTDTRRKFVCTDYQLRQCERNGDVDVHILQEGITSSNSTLGSMADGFALPSRPTHYLFPVTLASLFLLLHSPSNLHPLTPFLHSWFPNKARNVCTVRLYPSKDHK